MCPLPAPPTPPPQLPPPAALEGKFPSPLPLSQAGGSDAGLTDSVLEVPTYTLALFFFILLALSFAFELGVHGLTSFFRQRGRLGLGALATWGCLSSTCISQTSLACLP